MAALVVGLAVAGCASTRVGQLGRLEGDRALVTLIVSRDRDVVHQACRRPRAAGSVLGCQMSESLPLAAGEVVRSVKTVTIVRYADMLPSELAFDIDLHELCHAIASVQEIPDPCHADGGVVTPAAASR